MVVLDELSSLDLVRAHMEFGTVPANGGQALAAGTGKPDGDRPARVPLTKGF